MALTNIDQTLIYEATRHNFRDSKEDKIIRELLKLAFLAARDPDAAKAQVRGWVIAWEADFDAQVASRPTIRTAEDASDTTNKQAITDLLTKPDIGGS